MAKFRQLAITTISLGAVIISALTGLPAHAGGLPHSIAPLAAATVDADGTDAPTLKGKRRANIARAAICTEDLAQISFSEYTVNWTPWMNNVASRWAAVFNAAYASGKFRPEGPAFVQFTCNNNGSVSSLQILSSSGDMLCDRMQVQALKDCLPLPQFPAACKKKSVTMLYVWDFGVDYRTARMNNQKPVVQRTHAPVSEQRIISITGRTM